MINESPILITGIPRSGASMIAEILASCGAFVGNVSEKGMWSNEVIKTKIVEACFKYLKCDPKGQFPLPNTKDITFGNAWVYYVNKVIYGEGFVSGVWLYKDSCSTLIWPIWHYAIQMQNG